MASNQPAEIHFEGDFSRSLVEHFPDEIKRVLGFSLCQLQLGRGTLHRRLRSMSSIGAGVYELQRGRRTSMVPGDLPVQSGQHNLRLALL